MTCPDCGTSNWKITDDNGASPPETRVEFCKCLQCGHRVQERPNSVTMTELNDFDGETETTHSISESADKIVLKTSVKRGSATRDQDKINVKCKGSDPQETAARLSETLDALEEHGVAETLRNTQPE